LTPNPTPPVLIDLKENISSPIFAGLFSLLIPVVEKVLGVKKLNDLYKQSQGAATPEEFSERVLNSIGVQYDFPEAEIEKIKAIQGPIVVVCNHPFGGIESLILFQILSRFRDDYRIFGNYLLERIPEIHSRLLMVDPFEGKNAVQYNLAAIRNAINYLKAGGLIGMFPAGEVSSFNFKERKVLDKEWNEIISRMILKSEATVVPIYFHGENSLFFQIAGMVHPRLRTALLVQEFVNPKNRKIIYRIGKPISPARIQDFQSSKALSQYLQSKTYLLGYKITRPHVRLKRIRAIQRKPIADKIIQPISNEVLKMEVQQLPPDCLLVDKGELRVYAFEAKQAPQVLREIGRLREVTFRATGEGSGKAVDIDIYDDYYIHLFVWNQEKSEVVGGYRIGQSDEILKNLGRSGLYTVSLFKIQPQLFDQLGPSLEMGRSFVREEYQKSYAPLMLLWMGIGHFVRRHPQYRYLFGPVSITNDFHSVSQSILVSFLKQNNIDTRLGNLVKPRNDFKGDKKSTDPEFYNAFSIQNLNDVQELISEIETRNLKVPILLKHYLKLGGTLLAFNVDPDFNNVVDGLILVDLVKTDRRMLEKYMDGKGVDEYLKHHA